VGREEGRGVVNGSGRDAIENNAAQRARPFEAQGKRAVPLQGTQKFVEFVGGVEVGFEVAGG
jgi:hypothetical protein